MDSNNNTRIIDRRKYPRVNANITYSIKDSQSSLNSQGSKNISSGGIAFFARQKVCFGAVLDLIINLPDMSDVRTSVKVVWCEQVQVSEDDSICCELGVEFISLEEQAKKKIAKYLFLSLDKN
ncbi:MAG: PilZ domain-containing protein [Candidatus Omnitrophota bacterium]